VDVSTPNAAAIGTSATAIIDELMGLRIVPVATAATSRAGTGRVPAAGAGVGIAFGIAFGAEAAGESDAPPGASTEDMVAGAS
jgi:hypothetical protein